MDPARLEDRLSEFIERRERGEALTPEEFAREHLEGGAELLAALRALASTEALFPSGAPDLPARIGPYRVHGEIGRGGMGRVLEVSDPRRPEAPIALKLLHVSLAHQPRALERFRREGKALERISHPWIVRVHEAGLIDERPFLAMERIEGTNLAVHLDRARERVDSGAASARSALELPGEGSALERVARLVARLARAMAAAHREGVLHRDLNPRNVLVRPNGEPVVIDFGLMRASGAPTMTGSGDLLGTPQYLSPEQARGERVDERSDLFGLGTILWELLTLAPPRTADDTLALVREASTRPLGAFPATGGIPRELEVIARRATSFFPRWRYATCEVLAGDLELFLEGEPIRARAPGPVQRTAELLQVRRRPALVIGALAVALVLGLLLRGFDAAQDQHRRRIQRTNGVMLAWLDGDRTAARAALNDYLADEVEPPFGDYLMGLVEDDLARDSAEPGSRAMLAGERELAAGRAREARSSFHTAWDVLPGFPMVVLRQGFAALEAGELEAARPALEASAAAFSRSARFHRALAAVYEGLELPLDAQRALNAALALAPDDARSWLALARVRQLLGEDEQALVAARRALALDPETRPALAELSASWEGCGAARLARELRAVL